VRAFSGDVHSAPSSPVRMDPNSKSGERFVDPKITVSNTASAVSVKFVGAVGSNKVYRSMKVDLVSLSSANPFSASHMVANRAGRANFTGAKCGSYKVIVTGVGSNVTKEFARQTVKFC
ncbi:MAG: hypothetical protein WCI74_20690, partial [Actinomycetes bacterium]